MPDPSGEHQRQATQRARREPVRCAVLTVSDTRTLETDAGGRLIVEHATGAGHSAVQRAIVPDEPARIRAQLEAWLADANIDAILITGGTGIARRDTTIEVVLGLIDVELEGFGELLRMLSWQQVQAAAMLSRAVAGLVRRPSSAGGSAGGGAGGDTFIFAMPGSPNAVETAMKNLIAPQLAHLVWERTR